MMTDSRIISTPTDVFALVVSCGVGVTLGRSGVDLNIWDTHVKDDLPRSICDGMDGRLQEELSLGEVDSSSSQNSRP